MNCCSGDKLILIKTYDPSPKNPDGSISWYLYRWDDGKNGVRKLVQCPSCGAYYLLQEYSLHKFFGEKSPIFCDYYPVKNPQQADFFNRTYTGIQLERAFNFSFQIIKN